MEEPETSLNVRVTAAVASLNNQLGWNLTPLQVESYIAAVCKLVTAEVLDSQLDQILQNYHLDHQQVQAMLSAENPESNDIWKQHMSSVNAYLWSRHTIEKATTIEWDDIVQNVVLEIFRSMDKFRYESRFSTWSYSVAVRRFLRDRRDAQSQRNGRNKTVDSLKSSDEWNYLLSEEQQPEQIAEEAILAMMVRQLLMDTLGEQPALIFHLWAFEGFSLSDIVRKTNLHYPRVRMIAHKARDIVRNDDDVRAWLGLA